MRVVGGTARGVPLKSVPGDTTRPILDRVKTALFDILRPHIPGRKVLDLFGGSGSIGIEALSQGAEHCTFIDLEPKAIAIIRSNLQATKLSEKSTVRAGDSFAFLRRTQEKFDLVFIAPPQYKNFWIEALRGLAERPEILLSDAVVIAQIDPKEYEKLEFEHLSEASQRKYGNTLLVFYSKN